MCRARETTSGSSPLASMITGHWRRVGWRRTSIRAFNPSPSLSRQARKIRLKRPSSRLSHSPVIVVTSSKIVGNPVCRLIRRMRRRSNLLSSRITALIAGSPSRGCSDCRSVYRAAVCMRDSPRHAVGRDCTRLLSDRLIQRGEIVENPENSAQSPIRSAGNGLNLGVFQSSAACHFNGFLGMRVFNDTEQRRGDP